MHNSKILIIDDQLSHLRLIKKMLSRFGWQAVSVDSAEEAELILEWDHNFCAVITDLKMPWMNGVEFCTRAKRKYPEIKIYALSGNPDAFEYNELNNAGFDGFYFKPIRLAIIENILHAIESGVSDSKGGQ